MDLIPADYLQVFSEAHNPNVTNRSMGAECHLVMFYAPWCPFSAQAAPHFNGLARAFPDIGLYAVDSSKSQVRFRDESYLTRNPH